MPSVITPQRISLGGKDNDPKLDEGNEDNVVENFLVTIRFFPTPRSIAARILQLNQALGDGLIEQELEDLSSRQTPTQEDETFEKSQSWVDAVIAKVSSVLFHEETSSSERVTLSGEELVSYFQKVVSERIYDHLSFLSLSPQAKEGRTFSLSEELTEGIAEDLGLSLYRQSETPESLCLQAKDALLDLAGDFQRWLLEERGGLYTAGWGEIRARGIIAEDENAVTHPIVWLEPDVENRVTNPRYAGSVAAAR